MTWQQKLLRWYRRCRRDLPWRRTGDPYAIWVSEIMLQQTTVETVIPYYERFLKRFPTLEKLAAAKEEEVLRLWSGLGYYSRARNLRKAARQIVTAVGAAGRAPRPPTLEALIALPGIGRYTAGAIASIAFNQPAPILDGNVIRVLSRLFRIKKDPKTTKGQRYFWRVAGSVISAISEEWGRGSYGDFNQALMELGATVCTPEQPHCLACPLRNDCEVYRKDKPARYPRGKKKVKTLPVKMAAALIWRDGQVLIVQRPPQGSMKKMWEIPMVEGDASALKKSFSVELLKPLPVIRHSIMNHRISVFPWLCRPKGSNGWLRKSHLWIFPCELTKYPTSSLNHKIMRHVPETRNRGDRHTPAK